MHWSKTGQPTAAALDAHNGEIRYCYDHVLTTKPTAAGRVTVKLAVAEKTGRISDAKLDSSQTTAPDDVSQCVLAALPAATVSPGDPKRGEATWSWSFTVGIAPVSAPAKTP